MSKNFELMQQAQIGIGGSAALTGLAIGSTQPATVAEPAVGRIMVPDSAVREESLKLVQRLFLAPGQGAPKVVTFVGVEQGNGCSRLCAVSANLLAESVSGSVCLLEGDFRGPSLPALFGVDNHHGLSDALRQDGSIRNFARRVARDNLWLLSCGSLGPDALTSLSSDRMKHRIEELRKEFDYVLIDSPPLTAYADALIVGRLSDGAVLVVEANATRREAALRVADSLKSSRIPVLGVVLNKRTFPIPGALYKRL